MRLLTASTTHLQSVVLRERFDDIIVGAEPKACHHVIIAVFGREEDDWYFGRRVVLFESCRQFDAAHFAHHDVEQYEVVSGQVVFRRLLGTDGRIRHI